MPLILPRGFLSDQLNGAKLALLAYVAVCNNVRGLARLRNAQKILRLFGFYVLQIQQAGIRNEVRLRLVHQLYYGRVCAYAFAHKANAYPLLMAHGYQRVHFMVQLFRVNNYAWVHGGLS